MQTIASIPSWLRTMCFMGITTLALDCSATEPTQAITSPADNAPYTLLDADGKATSSHARCATVSGSGLTWELKTDDGSVHDKDNTYRWGGAGAEKTGTIFFDDWNSLLSATKSEKLCGFDDWRVPTIDELKTLATNTGTKPMLDTNVFPLTLAMPYWSVTTYQHYPEHAQTVDFATGTSNYYTGFRGDRLPLRLVRANKK